MQPFGRNKNGPKIGGLCPFWGGELGRHLTLCAWPGPRPTCMPSFILIRPTVRWPQCTNVTDRTGQRQDRQRTDSIGRTVFSERELMFTFAICYRPSVCLSYVCLSVCLSSVTLVRPTQAVAIFWNISTSFGTVDIQRKF